MNGLLPILIQAIITSATIGAGAVMIRWQVRRQWLAHSATLLASLEAQFRSQELLRARENLAHIIQVETQKSHKNQALVGFWSAVSFFDNLGATVHRGAIDEELVWYRFGWRITRCYIALTKGTKLLDNTRKYYDEPLMYEQFEWLANRMLRRYPSNAAPLEPTRATKEYIEQETTLLTVQKQLPPSGYNELEATPNKSLNPKSREERISKQ